MQSFDAFIGGLGTAESAVSFQAYVISNGTSVEIWSPLGVILFLDLHVGIEVEAGADSEQ